MNTEANQLRRTLLEEGWVEGSLAMSQLDAALAAERAIGAEVRPSRDWERAFRQLAEDNHRLAAIGAEAHDATYVDDGADGYLACRCGWGHVLGEDALVDHIHDARLTRERNGQ